MAGAGALRAQTIQLPVPPSTILTLSSPTTYSGTTITAAGNSTTVSITNGANVVFQATSTITLKPGFTAGSLPPGSGTTFQAKIDAGSPDFTISVSPSSQTVAAGSGTSYTATVTSVNGFSSPVSFTSSGWPSGASGSFNPSSVTPTATGATSTLNVTTSTSTPVGNSNITVTGTSGSLQHNAPTSLTVTSSSIINVSTIANLISCVSGTYPNEAPSPTPVTCQLATGTYPVTQTILVSRSYVTVTGVGTMDQTRLVRTDTNPPNTNAWAMMQVGSNTPLTGITIQNFLFCGSSTLSRPSTPADPCPTPVPTHCGNLSSCVDLAVYNAALPTAPTNPFSYTGPYAVEIANVDLEDATGHAVALYGNGRGNANPVASVNDIYIHNSTVNSSAVTGILIGANSSTTPGLNYYDRKVCDGDSNWPNDTSVYVPRNIRIENSGFVNNNTGAIGGSLARWVGVRNNNNPGFSNNYINPQAGNQTQAGGDIFFDQCSDTVVISGNTLLGPSVAELLAGQSQQVGVHSMELWGRNITVSGNSISNYPIEAVYLASVYNATVQGNTLTNNDTIYAFENKQQVYATGGIAVVTSDPGGSCNQIPRDAQTVTIIGNTSSGIAQAYGVRIGDRGVARNTIDSLTIASSNTLEPVALDAIEIDNPIVTLNSYSGATPTFGASTTSLTPRALATDVGTTLQKCISPAPGTNPDTFTFEASEVTGASKVQAIDVIFSSAGPAAPMCHFEYFPGAKLLYLDGEAGNDNWVGSSVVGSGGTTLTNGSTCTVYAGSALSHVTTEPNIIDLVLNIQFLSGLGSPTYMYTMVENASGVWSNGGGGAETWSPWGNWYIP
jgi:hypothetical protein